VKTNFLVSLQAEKTYLRKVEQFLEPSHVIHKNAEFNQDLKNNPTFLKKKKTRPMHVMYDQRSSDVLKSYRVVELF
jgi:hypothetical protein